ncbi:protein of unknown function [Candidatus Filomicrobium marinum]|uniref:Uncharacterized protein n=1 Tax=Candidatus Filomicrobium marinum TaxID=1608628 RepID=A0A0D6JET4_9HYPH|nr:protein of unknown function [Candidatus Filomicrobium marinum]CPR18901.1 protein of unknown function [Candidatus Filomicrobium marinum]
MPDAIPDRRVVMPSERSVYSDRSTMSSMFPHVVIYEMRSNLRRPFANPSLFAALIRASTAEV